MLVLPWTACDPSAVFSTVSERNMKSSSVRSSSATAADGGGVGRVVKTSTGSTSSTSIPSGGALGGVGLSAEFPRTCCFSVAGASSGRRSLTMDTFRTYVRPSASSIVS